MARIHEETAREIAWILQSANVDKPHPYTIDYVCNQVRMQLLRESISWIRFMRGL